MPPPGNYFSYHTTKTVMGKAQRLRNWGKGGKMDGKGNADLHHFNPVILSLVEKIQTVFPQSKASVGKMMKSRTGKLYANDMVPPFQRGKTHGLGFEM